ncbi:MAG: NADPH-dependent 7-cyano-7-deazaguanine reductase QueF [Leptospiraceae bacterium]|nr:NADPH-dependent 7-cyano-7-deazaguanine reductase QueF [Leptospiraceae bacterium]MCP5511486.1 NADPH-dependent 7-cyano-7-deazaguanine reductase QueF [Leptospiraceae bacterium]
MSPTESSYEGKQSHIPELQTPPLEFFSNVFRGKEYTIHFSIPEFTAICPKTGLPDFGTIYIDYIPSEKCIELKSLKEYINFYRNIGIFHENVVNKITEDIIRAIDPLYLKVFGDFHIRGGIKTKVEREYRKN